MMHVHVQVRMKTDGQPETFGETTPASHHAREPPARLGLASPRATPDELLAWDPVPVAWDPLPEPQPDVLVAPSPAPPTAPSTPPIVPLLTPPIVPEPFTSPPLAPHLAPVELELSEPRRRKGAGGDK
jgi:hypothetical protein